MFDAEYPPSLLVVDDVTAERIALVELLESQPSYRVYSAAKGTGALEILAKQKIGLVIIALRKPYEDGLSLICRVAEVHPEIGIVAVSGAEARDEDEEPDSSRGLAAALRLGAARALPKPIRAGEFFAAIEGALALPR